MTTINSDTVSTGNLWNVNQTAGSISVNNYLNVNSNSSLNNTSNSFSATCGSISTLGDIFLSGNTTGQIVFDQAKLSILPTFTTRSPGSRLIIYPNISDTQTDHAIGLGPYTTWYGVPDSSHYHSFYCGTTDVVDISGNGLKINTTFSLVNSSNTVDGSSGSLITQGDIFMYGSGSGQIAFDQSKGYAFPSTSVRSVGTRLILYPYLSNTDVDFSLGIGPSSMWYSVPNNFFHRFFCQTKDVFDITNTGVIINSTTVSTNVSSGGIICSGGGGFNGDLNAKNIYSNGQNIGIFGTNYNNVYNTSASTINNTVSSTKLSMTTGSLVSGLYNISLSYQYLFNSVNQGSEVKLYVGNTNGTLIYDSIISTNFTSSSSYQTSNIKFNFTSGVKNLIMTYKQLATGYTTTLQNVDLSLYRVL